MSFVQNVINGQTLQALELVKDKKPNAAILSAEAANHALTGYVELNGEVYAAYDGVRLIHMGVPEGELSKLENIAIVHNASLPASAVNLALYAYLEANPQDPAIPPAGEDVKSKMEFQALVAKAYLGLLAACAESNMEISSVLAGFLAGAASSVSEGAASKEQADE